MEQLKISVLIICGLFEYWALTGLNKIIIIIVQLSVLINFRFVIYRLLFKIKLYYDLKQAFFRLKIS